eukprot:TRINITY_DN34102_c0_g1_i1.p1 TRINITY_DN34102_c0_g1~~TRINITY_DN34102_c0_g1_i1.p1  ORF type:complete len:428 (-),score=85.65 TRINITY_DN34102_c0_g1_i1:87-1268(-)
MLGRWELPAVAVAADLKDQVRVACDESVVALKLLHGEEMVADDACLASFSPTGEAVVLQCAMQDAVAAMNDAIIEMEDFFDAIDRISIVEALSYAMPPEPLMKAACAFMIMLEKDVRSWAEFKIELGDKANVVQKIKTFNRDTIPSQVLLKLAKFVDDPLFTPERAIDASLFGGFLCQWLRLVCVYAQGMSGQVDATVARTELANFRRFAAMRLQHGVEDRSSAPTLRRKVMNQVSVDQFKASQDYETLQAYVAVQERLPFVACDDLSVDRARECLQEWSTLTERLGSMLFEESPDLHFPVALIDIARQILDKDLARSNAGNFLKSVDSWATRIAANVETALRNDFNNGLDGSMSSLAEDIAGLAAVWSSWRASCKLHGSCDEKGKAISRDVK